MAEVLPFNAVHYDLGKVSSLADVTAPPYDVIDADGRRALLARSERNIVEIDLPEAPDGDPYEHAARTLGAWLAEGVLRQDPEPAIWALTQRYRGPDGVEQIRSGFFARVRVTDYGPGKVRPHERTQPGPKEDRLRLTRATRHNLSPIFSLYDRDAWPTIEPALSGEPWGEVTDPDGTVHTMWRIDDPAVHETVAGELAEAELLIADGHHRYETSRTYAEEIGGEGPHRYVLMNLVSLSDPGLTVFPTHRLLTGLSPDQHEPLGSGLGELFDLEEIPMEELEPEGEEGVGVFGYIDSHLERGFRLRLKDAGAAERALANKPEPYRRLDPAILEALVLKGILGMTEEDVAAKRGIGYAKSREAVVSAIEEGSADCAFLLRSTPVEQVREIAATGENMPPKSTYFFPKLLTGLVLNPLA